MSSKRKAEREVNPPYVSQNVWKPFFKKMRAVKKPNQLSIAELKEYGLAGGQGPALQSALKFLGLLDPQGKTTDKFKAIQVSGEQFKKNLGQILDEAYADLFAKHPLNHATYESLQNYFAQKYSPASAKKMAKSFAVLCQLAGIDSPAFSKMRSLEKPERSSGSASPKTGAANTVARKPIRSHKRPDTPGGMSETSEDLVRDFIKSNPMPTGVQWDTVTLKAYFEEYRATLKMLRGEEEKNK
ncbi:MAG: DUF5343 domain-containing protein [Nitrospiraceae bacterium]